MAVRNRVRRLGRGPVSRSGRVSRADRSICQTVNGCPNRFQPPEQIGSGGSGLLFIIIRTGRGQRSVNVPIRRESSVKRQFSEFHSGRSERGRELCFARCSNYQTLFRSLFKLCCSWSFDGASVTVKMILMFHLPIYYSWVLIALTQSIGSSFIVHFDCLPHLARYYREFITG